MIDQKEHIYFMPGMAASPAIFENIRLAPSQFKCHYLTWTLPQKGMDIAAYARAISKQVKHPNAILIGVSFGGILVQEMAKIIPVKKTIIVSSVKCNAELPKRMLFARYTKAHKLLPTGLINNVGLLAKYAFGETVTKRLELYEKYLAIRDKSYIDWAIDNIVNWEQKDPQPNTIHIHGEKDTVFPMTNIKDCIRVKNGTHTMIIHRARWFNEHLPGLLLD